MSVRSAEKAPAPLESERDPLYQEYQPPDLTQGQAGREKGAGVKPRAVSANGGGAPRPRFTLIPFDKLAIADSEPPFLVKGIIPREGLVVVWGPPKCGKTFWTFDLVMHIALGWLYRGRRTERGPVVYVACEGERGLTRRAEAFRQTHLSEHADAVPFYLVTTRLDLVGEAKALTGDIRNALGSTAPAVIVIDTLNRSLRGSESSDEDMSVYIKACDMLREAFDCAVIVVHHCGVDDRRPRGHTSLAGAADAQISIARDGGGGVIRSKVEFLKDGAEGDEILSRLESVPIGQDRDGEPITSCVIVPVEGGGLPHPAKKLGKRAALALQALHDIAAERGEPLPERVAPASCRGVPIAVWRDELQRRSLLDGKNPRQQFRDLRETLALVHAIGVRDELVWSAQ